MGKHLESQDLQEAYLAGNTIIFSTTKIKVIYLNQTCINSLIKDWSYPVNFLIVNITFVNIVKTNHLSFSHNSDHETCYKPAF